MKIDGRLRARGIVVTPAEVANEGVESVLDKIQETGANSVAVSPGLFVPSTRSEGVREPPLDLEGEARVLDRALWGRKVQYLKGFAPYVSDPNVWKDVPFPAPTPAPKDIRVDYAQKIVQSALKRGMSSYIVSSPTLLPGLPGGQSATSGTASRSEADRLVRVDGTTPSREIAGQGCVNSPRIQALARARLTDTLTHYPDANGLFTDWIEFTCYLPEDVFTCFCRHCALKAQQSGFDWDAIKGGVGHIWEGLGGVTNARLQEVIEAEPTSLSEGLALMSNSLEDTAAIRELFRFKTESVSAFFSSVQSLAGELKSSVDIGANGFAPPWNEVTGVDFGNLSSVVHTLRCKLFTFHWPMMTKWLGEMLMNRNPDLSSQLVLNAAKVLYQVPTGPEEARRSLVDYGMPGPEQPHPITPEALTNKLQLAKKDVRPSSVLEAYIHSYRPAQQFEQVIRMAEESGSDGVWVQRYGYLSDQKLKIIRDMWAK